MLWARTKAEDGMNLDRFEDFNANTIGGLPGPKVIKKTLKKLADDLKALRQAPVMEPYSGPAILSGDAAGVFFHEIFGHRIEGDQQKDERDGQTFTKKVGEKILPDFVSVYDDPTLKKLGREDLRGHYLFDDEGVRGQKVTVVENGVLKTFLMSRTPLEGFSKSNGHGRAQPGRKPVSRQGNLIIKTSKPVTQKKLREMLKAECKKQDKPYGLFFDAVTSGFTLTGRVLQAFNVRPVMVYRVYTDGRPDELVRGVELIGTPLTSFSKMLAMSDKPEVFNGTCGAMSGAVPVSGIAPDVLTAEIEVQKKRKSTDRPPLLPPPGRRSK
jgi:predicted Zn-dependent protease